MNLNQFRNMFLNEDACRDYQKKAFGPQLKLVHTVLPEGLADPRRLIRAIHGSNHNTHAQYQVAPTNMVAGDVFHHQRQQGDLAGVLGHVAKHQSKDHLKDRPCNLGHDDGIYRCHWVVSGSLSQGKCSRRRAYQHYRILQCDYEKSETRRLLFCKPAVYTALPQRSRLPLEQSGSNGKEAKRIVKDRDASKTSAGAARRSTSTYCRHLTTKNYLWRVTEPQPLFCRQNRKFIFIHYW